MCESQQSPLLTDQEAPVLLGSLSLEWNTDVSPTDDNRDLSASQIIHNGVDTFRVVKTPTKKTHSQVKEVSRNYLYGYCYFVQCIWVVLLR